MFGRLAVGTQIAIPEGAARDCMLGATDGVIDLLLSFSTWASVTSPRDGGCQPLGPC